MKLIVNECKANNQDYWQWTDGYDYYEGSFRTKKEALEYGLDKGYIDEITLYPEYNIITV